MNKIVKYMSSAFCAALVLCGCASLPDEELSPADITLAELEEKMSQATDPEGRFAQAKSFVMKQVVETKRFLDQPLVQMVETKFMRPDFFKITTYEDNQPVLSIISNGESSWVVDYNSQKVRTLDAEQLRQVKRFSDVTKPGSRLSAIFKDIRIQKCRIGDEEYYKVECPGDDGSMLNVYVDADTYQTSRISISAKGESTYDSSLKGYGLYEGVRIPEETSVRTGGVEKTSRVIYCKLNSVIDPAEFRPRTF
jgi:outer membrane lipoprotein-sorting protein